MAEHFTITWKDGGVLIEGRIETRYTMAELCSTLRELGLVLPEGNPPPIAGDPDRVTTQLHLTRTTVTDRVGEIEHTVTEERFTNKINFGGHVDAFERPQRCFQYWGDPEKRCVRENGHPGPHQYQGICGKVVHRGERASAEHPATPDLLCRRPPGHDGDCSHGSPEDGF